MRRPPPTSRNWRFVCGAPRVNGHLEVPTGGQRKSPPGGVLAHLLAPGRGARLGLFHPERFAVGGDHDRVVQEAVEQDGGGGLVGQEPVPVLEGVVGGQPHRAAFVGGGDEPEQQLCSGGVQRGELGRGQDALPAFAGRSSCPRPPNRTCALPRIRLSTCRGGQLTSSVTCPTKATSSWSVLRKRAPAGSTSPSL